MSAEQPNREIEGACLGFRFHADYTSQMADSAMEFLVVENGRVKELWHPCDLPVFIDTVNDRLDIVGIRFLRTQGIKVVHTPGDGSGRSRNLTDRKFLNFDLSWFEDDNNWGFHYPLGQRDAGILSNYGIELKFLGDNYLSSQG